MTRFLPALAAIGLLAGPALAVAQTVSGGVQATTSTTTFNSLPSGTVTPATTNSITTASTLQSLFTAGSIANGCYVQNIQPNGAANTAILVVDPIGTTGTTPSAAAVPLLPGQQYTCSVKPTTAITVFSPTTGLTFSAGRF